MKSVDGQNVFDACLQGYGDLEQLIKFITDNNLTINTELSGGVDLIIDETIGNIQIKEFVKVNNVVLLNRTTDNDIQVAATVGIQWPVFVDPAEIINQHLRIVP